MNSLSEFLIRISAFVRKEMAAILRQPRLVAILVLGPFLILLIFGVGYRNLPRTLRTVVVIPAESQIRDEINDILGGLRGTLDIVGTVDNEQDALGQLDRREIDLVLVTPADPYADVSQNEQSRFQMIHHEIDPLEVLFVNTLERAYVQEVNRQVLIRAVAEAQMRAANVQEKLAVTQADAESVRNDLTAGDGLEAFVDIRRMAVDFEALNLSIASSLSLFEGVQTLAEDPQASVALLDEQLSQIQDQLDDLAELAPSGQDFSAEIAEVEAIQRELQSIADFFTTFRGLDGRVLVSPFAGETVAFTRVQLGQIDFYVPGVIALLLQHMAITLAALSIVRERNGGTIELFRAAPLSSMETLLGKMISFLILTGVLAAVLTALVVLGLRTPMLGTWVGYAAIVTALLFTSLSLGFAISVISQSDSQAVQFSMIVLLASIFFSGFFIALYRMLPAVQIVSWLLPATYGTALLQDVMLRGQIPSPFLLSGLIFFGVVLFLFAWWRMRHLMARE